MTNLARYRKFIVALIGLAAQAVNEGLIHGTAAHWVTVVIAALTAAGVVVTPNEGAA